MSLSRRRPLSKVTQGSHVAFAMYAGTEFCLPAPGDLRKRALRAAAVKSYYVTTY